MTEIAARPAMSSDIAFLALAMQQADRGHTGIGSWDVMFPGPEHDRLHILAGLASAPQRSYVHWSTFLVAEAAGRAVATVAGYVPDETPAEVFDSACRHVLGQGGSDRIEPSWQSTGAWSREYFAVILPGDTLRLEWVYTDPAYRGRGISAQLIGRLLDTARERGLAASHVATYVGNEPAITTYRRAGFEHFADGRHADYESRFHAPGLTYLRRSLR